MRDLNGKREVLVLTPAMDGADGISEVSRQMVAAITEANPTVMVEVWALAGGKPDTRTLGGATFCSAGGSRTRLSAWALARAGSASEDLLVVVLHVHLAPLALALGLRGARLAFFFHGIEVWSQLRGRERRALDRADVLMANSHWTVARFKEANPEYRSADIRVCHLGVPPAAPAEPPAARDFALDFALIVGRLSAEERYKGHDALIDIWPRVRDAVPDAGLMIVGDGNDRGRLESRVSELGLASAVRFAGRVSNEALSGFYRAAGFFVMPSAGEGFGLTYLEAMRAGKACVAGPGAAAEIVEDGVTGLIVDPAKRDALAGAVIRLFSEPGTRAAMGRAGAARVRAQFEARHFADRVLEELSMAVVHA